MCPVRCAMYRSFAIAVILLFNTSFRFQWTQEHGTWDMRHNRELHFIIYRQTLHSSSTEYYDGTLSVKWLNNYANVEEVNWKVTSLFKQQTCNWDYYDWMIAHCISVISDCQFMRNIFAINVDFGMKIAQLADIYRLNVDNW